MTPYRVHFIVCLSFWWWGICFRIYYFEMYIQLKRTTRRWSPSRGHLVRSPYLKLQFLVNSSFRNAWFRTFFPFLQVEAVACLEKNNNSIQRSRNTFKFFFKSKIKIEINHWDHELQFPDCLIPHFFSFLQVEAVAFLDKKQYFYQPF